MTERKPRRPFIATTIIWWKGCQFGGGWFVAALYEGERIPLHRTPFDTLDAAEKKRDRFTQKVIRERIVLMRGGIA